MKFIALTQVEFTSDDTPLEPPFVRVFNRDFIKSMGVVNHLSMKLHATTWIEFVGSDGLIYVKEALDSIRKLIEPSQG